jgi:membrane protein required for colicin V production
MNWLDIVSVIALIVPTLIGFFQGFIKTLLSLIGLVIGIVVASRFYETVSGWLGFIPNDSVARIVAFVLLLVAVMVVAALIAKVLKALLKAIMLGWADHLAGGILGLIFGVFFVGALLAGFVKFFGDSMFTESLVARFLLDKLPIVLAILPAEFDAVRGFFP